jgi:hypothetical protein
MVAISLARGEAVGAAGTGRTGWRLGRNRRTTSCPARGVGHDDSCPHTPPPPTTTVGTNQIVFLLSGHRQLVCLLQEDTVVE